MPAPPLRCLRPTQPPPLSQCPSNFFTDAHLNTSRQAEQAHSHTRIIREIIGQGVQGPNIHEVQNGPVYIHFISNAGKNWLKSCVHPVTFFKRHRTISFSFKRQEI